MKAPVAGRASALAPAVPWLLLAAVGQALMLALVEAGNLVGYPHYPPPPRLWEDPGNRWLLAGIVGQASCVALGLVRVWPRVRAGAGLLPAHAWVVLAALFVLTSAALSREVPHYLAELILASTLQAIQVGNVLLIALAPDDERLAAGPGRPFFDPDERSVPLDAPVLWGALWVAGLGALLAVVSYGRHPHIPDEVAYVFHARYFAAGLLDMPLPPVPEAFDVDLMQYEAHRWYSPFPPGWPAILALGMKLGVGWLVNPILNGLNVVLASALVARLYDRASARLVLLLLCTSPWFLLMGMNYMAHTSTLTCVLIAALALQRVQRGGGIVWAWVSGFATGWVSLIRPLDGVTLAAVLGVCALGLRGARFRLAPAAALTAGSLLIGGLNLPYNAHITGDPAHHPVMAYFDHYYGEGVNDMGFGPDRGVGWTGLDPRPGHDLLDALINGNLNLFMVNVELLGWATGSLLLAGYFLLAGSLTRVDWIFAGSIALTIGLHSFYWFSGGPDFGARYWYLILLPVLVLTARGIQTLGDALGPEEGRERVRLGVVALCALAILTFVPWRAVDKYPRYRMMTPGLRELAARTDFGRSLVLVRGRRHPDYASAFVYNPVDLAADAPLFVWDRGPEVRAALARAFPDRTAWVVDGPTRTGADFRVVAGPLPAGRPADVPPTEGGER